eukprot:CAMPEP_0177734426 /NCGR_PEP_ID=MMETSP0484_2-20121128/24223_1 /TAXON_ID=354590 /ORGANISM="Rhodomonas lens, Strain RHODO" /LENGTH=55 /DNA_ID=CAMNT_0019247895 /DNA_START=58 /DNA_END=221 /DNA_ORIENTATION=-
MEGRLSALLQLAYFHPIDQDLDACPVSVPATFCGIHNMHNSSAAASDRLCHGDLL